MGFPVEDQDGNIVEVVKVADDTLVAADGTVFERSADALRVQVSEAGAAIDDVAKEVSESIGEVTKDIEGAAKAVAADVSDLVDAAEVAGKEVGDVADALGDVVRDAADDPVGAARSIIDALDGEKDATPAEPPVDPPVTEEESG